MEIRNQSNKDLRNAIVTLQFLSAGRVVNRQLMVDAKRKKVRKATTIIEEEDEDGDMSYDNKKKPQRGQ